MIRRPPRSTLSSSSAASDVYKRQVRGHADLVAELEQDLSSSACLEESLKEKISHMQLEMNVVHKQLAVSVGAKAKRVLIRVIRRMIQERHLKTCAKYLQRLWREWQRQILEAEFQYCVQTLSMYRDRVMGDSDKVRGAGPSQPKLELKHPEPRKERSSGLDLVFDRVFDKMDANHDGLIDQEEWTSFLQPQQDQRPQEATSASSTFLKRIGTCLLYTSPSPRDS
eukprot:TRINITY_DN55240_c0_g2_i1.p1 TRINITY_DN55240_c0_g2~~TRINITY_DN55240_c0_g2_i1.p1  ORF type:complete len:225 (+),score=46.34 TRINITY_DN55240_c0_g2_i1:82-756(+)